MLQLQKIIPQMMVYANDCKEILMLILNLRTVSGTNLVYIFSFLRNWGIIVFRHFPAGNHLLKVNNKEQRVKYVQS